MKTKSPSYSLGGGPWLQLTTVKFQTLVVKTNRTDSDQTASEEAV